MTPPLISIVVPIYNVEPYLSACIDSILAQTYTHFELILVNDGSTDKCGEICDFYAQKDARVRVVHKVNQGVSSSRNKGIELAEGDYIGFVDPDDTIEPEMYELLIDAARLHKTDLVICPIKTINLLSDKTSISTIWKDSNCKVDKKMIETLLIPSILIDKTYSLVSCVNKLYKKSLFSSHGLKFNEKKHHSEDARLNFTLLTMIDHLVYIEQPLYNYYIRRKNSLSQVFREDLYEYALDNKNFLIELCQKLNLGNYVKIVRNHYAAVTLLHMQDVVCSNIPMTKKHEIIKGIMNDKQFNMDIAAYKCPSIYYKILKIICILKRNKLFYQFVKVKNKQF